MYNVYLWHFQKQKYDFVLEKIYIWEIYFMNYILNITKGVNARFQLNLIKNQLHLCVIAHLRLSCLTTCFI